MTGTCHIVIAMKPAQGGFVQNALKHGVAGLNIDGCRIGFVSEEDFQSAKFGTQTDIKGGGFCTKRPSEGNVLAKGVEANRAGRWPANVIHDGSEKVTSAFPVMHAGGVAREKGDFQKAATYFGGGGKAKTGHRFGDTGSASRFFFQVKEFRA